MIVDDYHFIRGSRILVLEKLTPMELYKIPVSSSINKGFSVIYFESIFSANNLDRAKMYTYRV